MKVRYIGAESAPESGTTTVFGNIQVRCGEIFDCPVQFRERVLRHPHFEMVEDAPQAPDEDAEDVEEYSSFAGKTKEELVELASKTGVSIDKRWSAQRIAKAIQAAAAELTEPEQTDA